MCAQQVLTVTAWYRLLSPRPDPHQQHIYRALVGTLVCEMMQHRAARLGQRAFSAVETVMRHPQQSSRKAMFQVATRSIALCERGTLLLEPCLGMFGRSRYFHTSQVVPQQLGFLSRCACTRSTSSDSSSSTIDGKYDASSRGSSNEHVTLLSPDEAGALPPLSARDLTLYVRCSDGNERAVDVLVVRGAAGGLTAYENSCPHQGGPLNASPGGELFFDRRAVRRRDRGSRQASANPLAAAERVLVCSRHGAQFLPEDGLCVRGPCAGYALHGVNIAEGGSGSVSGVTITLAEAIRTAIAGGRLVSAEIGEHAEHHAADTNHSRPCVKVVLHPKSLDAAVIEMDNPSNNAATLASSSSVAARATPIAAKPAYYPMPRTPAPLDTDGVTRCTWDGELGCWREASGRVRFR